MKQGVAFNQNHNIFALWKGHLQMFFKYLQAEASHKAEQENPPIDMRSIK